MNSKFLLFFVGLFFIFGFSSDKSYPQDYFRSPVDHRAYISGTFGELRPNHFHSGIDIKSKHGKIGDPLYAAAEGFVSRIKVQASGYGKALYIDHPNGYTTVYGHLDYFNKDIEDYIKSQQYDKESFYVDLYPEKGRFTYNKGDKIGTMGTRGRSSGPHLHYEIRNTITEEPINPLLFGFKAVDNIPPKLHQIKVYGLNDKHETIDASIRNVAKGKSGTYYVGGDTLTIKAWRMGVGIKAYDFMDGSSSWNGVYAIETYIEDRLVHKTEFEKFHFDNTRYVNAHADYRERLLQKAWFNRCYRLNGNEIPMYPVLENDGVFSLESNRAKKVTIIVSDYNKNQSKLVFWVKRSKEIKPQNRAMYNYLIPYDQESYIDNGELFMHFPKHTFYENLYLKYSSSPDDSENTYSNMFHIHDENLPVHKWFKIGIRPNKRIPEHLKENIVITKCEDNKKPENFGGQWEGDMLVTYARELGNYCMIIDDLAPTIKPIVFNSNMKGYSRITFKIQDNMNTSSKLDECTWKGYIDGKWVLFEPNSSSSVITHYFDNLPSGKHTLRLEVKDNSNNTSVFEKEFIR